MTTLKTYIELCRISNLPTVWSNVLAAVILSGEPFSWGAFSTLALSLSLFYSAGMALNDIFDAAIDRIQRPGRPIPSGRITPLAAYLLTGGLFVAAFALLFAFSHRSAVFAGFVLLVLIILYDRYHKGHPSSVLLMAACRAMVYVVSGYALAGKISGAVLTVALIQFGYIVCISVTARYENHRSTPFTFPVIPLMLAGICLVDGIFLAAVTSPFWLAAGVCGMLLTLMGQRFVRGD
ncbi:MAG: UbiA family prenyltransferase [Desulfuromonadaceae bacterium]|nr:UbiA family prenyltransferase [Desulfuromonadaceae bacterium]